MLKITRKALYDDTLPEYLRLIFHTVSAYNLRSLEAPKLAIPVESGTFQDSAARLLNRAAVGLAVSCSAFGLLFFFFNRAAVGGHGSRSAFGLFFF